MDRPQIISHVNKSLDYTLFDSKWIPISSKFVVVGATPRSSGKIQSEKSASFKCCTLGASPIPSYHLATGAFDGRMAIWNIEKDDRLDQPIYGVQAHEEIINCIDAIGGAGVGEGAPEILTGSRDGSVKVWDPRQKNSPVVTVKSNLPDNNKDQSRRDCWAVAFGNAYTKYDRCIVAGYDNGDVKMFDLRKMKVTWEDNLKNGIVSLEFDRKDIEMNKLVATTLEGNMHVFDLRTQHPKRGYSSLVEKVNNSTIWQVKHLPQQRDIFMTSSGSGSVSLWKYSYPMSRKRQVLEEIDGNEVKTQEGVMGTNELLQNITISSQPISSFDWCPEKLGLAVSTGFDQILRLLIVTKLNVV